MYAIADRVKTLFAVGIVFTAGAVFSAVETVTSTLPVDCSTARIVPSGYDGYVAIDCAGLDAIPEPAGAPQLLTEVLCVDAPKGAKFLRATYEADWVTLGENVKLVPIQPLIISEEQPKEIPFAEPNPALYASYPESPIATFGIQRMAGKAFVPVRVIPFRYTNGKLEAAKRFVVKVEFEVPPPRVKTMSSPAHEIPAGEDYVKTDPNQPDYILIAPKNYFNLWKWYVDERQKDHPEKKLLAKNFAEILADFPVNTTNSTLGYYARNDAERLHAYIRQEAHKGTHYFVLAGSWYDAHGCPADGHVTTVRKELTVTTPQAQYKTNADWGIPGIYTNPRNEPIPNQFDPGAKPCPSDLFYACCDLPDGAKYPWDYGSFEVADPEGDGWYANEPDERIDLIPDVVVTRIGFICGMTWRPGYETLTMQGLVEGFLAKVRKVESPDFAGRNRFAGGGASFTAEPGLTHGSTLREEMEYYAGTDNVFDKRHASRWLDTDYVVTLYLKDWFSRYLPALHTEYISETTLPPWEPDWNTAVKNLHKQDWEISTVMSHGSQGGSASKVFINEYAQTATGLSKIFFAPFPCLMSYPDWTPSGNRSGTHKITHNHSLIENPTGGATFTIGNTRSGWGGGIINRDCSVGDGLGDKMGGYFVKAYVRDRKNPGDAWLHMIQTYAAKGLGWSTGRWILVIDQALGDPLLETRFLSDYTWEGNTTGTDVWDLKSDKWMHIDEDGNEIHGRYEHAANASITTEGDLTMNVATNAVGALRLVVDQPAGATFKLMGGIVRVATNMVVSAGDVTFGVGGGVGHEGLEFLNGKGNIRFEGDEKFYLAKIKNGGTVTFAGSNGLLDFRNFYWTFDGFVEPIVTKKVTGKTLDIEALAFEGEGTGNIIRSDYPGVLTQYLPAAITNQQFRLETYNGFEGALAAEKSLEIVNGKMTIASNPNYALAENKCFEALDIPLTLDNSTLEVEYIKTFTLGRSASSAQAITVRGDSAITSASNGRIGLYGTTTINLASSNTTLTLSAPLDNRANAKLVFTGSGTLIVENSAALVGDVEIGEGITVVFKAVPLPQVTKLEIGDNARVVLPKNASGSYQVTPIVGSKLIVGEGVTFYNGSLDNLIENAVVNANGSVFDPSGVLTWHGGEGEVGAWSGNAWYSNGKVVSYVNNSGVLFTDSAGSAEVISRNVAVDGAYVGKFMQFANALPYTFTGTVDNASLDFSTMTIGGDAQFRNLDLKVSGHADLMNGKLEADYLNTEELSVYDGATLAAGKVGFAFDKIRYIRLYFLDHLNDEPQKTKEHRVRMEEIYFNYKDENGGDHTIRNYDISWKGASGGRVNGNLNVLFDGEDHHGNAVGNATQYSAEIVADADTGLSDMAAGKVYLQVNLNHAIPMLSSFGIHSSQRTLENREMTHAYRPTKFRIEASYDGVTYYPIMPDFGNRNIGGNNAAYYGGWVGGNSTAFKCNYQSAHPSSVEVLVGGTLSAEGDYNANVTFEDGATVKAVPGKKLTASETSTWTFAENGKVKLDTSALTLSDEPQVVLEDAKNFTFATLYQFEPSEGASLRYLDGGKIAVVRSDDMNGPYTRTFGGDENWNTSDWCYQGIVTGIVDFVKFEKPWSEHRLDTTTDVVIDLAEGATITVDCDIEIDTIRACETNNLAGRSLSIVSDGVHNLKAQTLDFSGFDGDVVYGLDCGAAHVVAGLSLKLLGSGTGVLEVQGDATVTLTQPWQGTIIGSGKIVLAAAGGTWHDLSLFERAQVPTIEIPSGFRLALPPDNAAISAADVKKLTGSGEICYYGDGVSTYETIPLHAVASTLKFGVDNGVFNLGDVSVPGLIVGPRATFSATSLADSSKIRYIRVYFKSATGNNIRLSRFRVSANGHNIGLGGSVTCTGATSYSGLGMLTKADEPQWIEFMLFGGDFPSITATPEKYANREVYLTFNLSSAIEMFDHYAIQSAQNGWGTPTSWDVEVSTDGQEFVPVGSAAANISGDLIKYTGTASRVAPVTVEAGGTLLANGEITAKITLKDGAVVKPLKGKQLVISDKSSLVLPEMGVVTIDLSEIDIPKQSDLAFITGYVFTQEDLKRFRTTEKRGYSVQLGENGSLLLLNTGKVPPQVLFR